MERNGKELIFKIGIVNYDLYSIIDEWVGEEFRPEAYEIIHGIASNKINDEILSYKLCVEFIIYNSQRMGNQICQHLDFMKDKLVFAKVLERGGIFGFETGASYEKED